MMSVTDEIESRPRARRWRKVLIRIGLALALVAAALYLGVGAVAAGELTLPDRKSPAEDTPADHGMSFEDVRFPARGEEVQIAAWFIPAQGSSEAVVMVHGRNQCRSAEFGGCFLDLAAALHDAAFAVLMIDLRGHGESGEGRFSFGVQERRDVLGAVDWLEARGFAPHGIGLLGVSLGAASAVGAMADDPEIGALVTDSGFAAIYPLIEEQWQEESGLPQLFLCSTRLMVRLLYGYDVAASRPVDEIGSIPPRPVLLIHCQTDTTVPMSHLEQLSDTAPGAEVWIVPGCEHARAYGADAEAYEERVIEFLAASLR
jgi:pimeloyl-ACP methyl ester carboxylesterase